MPGGQAEMGENLGDDPGLFDGGDDLEFAATNRSPRLLQAAATWMGAAGQRLA